MTRRTKRKKDPKNGLFVFFWLVIFSSLLVAGFILKKTNTLRIASNDSAKNSLQIDYFIPSRTPTVRPSPIPISTPTPRPTPGGSIACNHEAYGPVEPGCICNATLVACRQQRCVGLPRKSTDPLPPDPPLSPFPCGRNPGGDSQYDRICSVFAKGGNGIYCVEKPVIYLYPEKNTLVNVQVHTSGSITISDPHYPEEGWQKVLAHPDGALFYHGKTYSELFYETGVSQVVAPKTGIVIPTQNLEADLRHYISLLGLTKDREQQEFLDWWVPRLQALYSPYIFFSVLEQSEKKKVDSVEISPKPDTFIEFLAYFKQLSKIEPVEKLEITPAPKRLGFTAVEWGGVIDNK